jgi:hypothetical protein
MIYCVTEFDAIVITKENYYKVINYDLLCRKFSQYIFFIQNYIYI